MVGADPFALPNARKAIAAANNLRVAGMRPPLRDALPPLNLFSLRPPRPQIAGNFTLPGEADQLLASTRVSGIVNAAEGIFAVVEVNGNSQTVKPGDSIGGNKVASIQSTGITLHTEDGATITIPLSNGPPQQNPTNGFGGGYPGGGGFGGYPGGGFGGGYPGGGGGGFGGGGYPGGGGGGFGGGGYPGGGGGGFGGGGYPGGGGGGGGYPGGGGAEGGGGY